MTGVHRHKKLLEDKDIERWYRNVARGSETTADVQLRGLGRFSEWLGKSPKGFLDLNEKEREDAILDYVTHLENKGKTGSSINSYLKPVKSWLRFNNLELRQRIKVKWARVPVTLKGERVPTQNELKAIFRSANKGSRVCCVLMAHAGVRPEVLGNYRGNDGLNLGDFPDLVIEKDHVEFKNVPARVVVRTELSKAGHEYFSFIGPEGAEIVTDYLNERLRSKEVLSGSSPLVIPKWDTIHFITTNNIGDQIRKAIRSAGYEWRPYVLRAYFASQTLLAESKEGISRDYRVFFMGHKGDIEHTYTMQKALSEESIEDMRKAYTKTLNYLETEKKGIPEEQYNKDIKGIYLTMLISAGYTEEEIEKENMLDLSPSEIGKKISEKKTMDLNDGNSQKVIRIKEVKDYISKGWEYVNTLPGNKEVIVKLP